MDAILTKFRELVLQAKGISEHSQQIRCLKEDLSFSGGPIASLVLHSGTSSAYPSAAFWFGYQMAVQRLFASTLQNNSDLSNGVPRRLASLVVNEKRSSKPADWQTVLLQGNELDDDSIVVNGNKDFITAADQVDYLLVGARNGQVSDEVVSKSAYPFSSIVSVPVEDDGIKLTPFHGMPVFPELKKARGCFSSVNVSSKAVLSGDGYSSYVKPFRLIEDLYVSVALLGYVIRLIAIERGEDVLLDKSQSRLFLLLEVLPAIEDALSALAPDFTNHSLVLESWLTEVAVWIKDQVAEYSECDSFKQLSNDLMVMKIGAVARGVRFARAIDGLKAHT